MKVDKKDIENVIAMFDPEDVPYIQSEFLLLFGEEKINSNEKEKVKVKRMSDENDRSRK